MAAAAAVVASARRFQLRRPRAPLESMSVRLVMFSAFSVFPGALVVVEAARTRMVKQRGAAATCMVGRFRTVGEACKCGM